MVHFEEFEGPLDLLLDEVRRQNVAIEKIAMAPIVARFLEYVQTAAGRNLNLDIEWLDMAATLIHWKSRSILPAETGEQPAADPIRDELVQQLLAYRKQAAKELARRQSIESSRFSRSFEGDVRGAPAGGLEESPFLTVWDMIQQAQELAAWVEKRRESQDRFDAVFGVEQDDVTLAELIGYLQSRLAEGNGRLDGLGLLNQQAPVSRRAGVFLAMLEMAQHQQITICQEESFGPLWLMRPDMTTEALFNMSTVDR